MPAAAVIRRVQTLPGFTGRKEMRRCLDVFLVKFSGSTGKLLRILSRLRGAEANGILGGAVKCVDTERNTRGEGGLLGPSAIKGGLAFASLTLRLESVGSKTD